MTGGYASLTPVCNRPPLQGLIILWQCRRKGVIAGPLGHCVRDELLCKIAELAENILAVLCVATFENVLPQSHRLTSN